MSNSVSLIDGHIDYNGVLGALKVKDERLNNAGTPYGWCPCCTMVIYKSKDSQKCHYCGQELVWSENKSLLKSCPFCGSKATVNYNDYSKVYFAGCCSPYCKICPQTLPYETKEEAVNAWNRRI